MQQVQLARRAQHQLSLDPRVLKVQPVQLVRLAQRVRKVRLARRVRRVRLVLKVDLVAQALITHLAQTQQQRIQQQEN